MSRIDTYDTSTLLRYTRDVSDLDGYYEDLIWIGSDFSYHYLIADISGGEGINYMLASYNADATLRWKNTDRFFTNSEAGSFMVNSNYLYTISQPFTSINIEKYSKTDGGFVEAIDISASGIRPAERFWINDDETLMFGQKSSYNAIIYNILTETEQTSFSFSSLNVIGKGSYLYCVADDYYLRQIDWSGNILNIYNSDTILSEFEGFDVNGNYVTLINSSDYSVAVLDLNLNLLKTIATDTLDYTPRAITHDNSYIFLIGDIVSPPPSDSYFAIYRTPISDGTEWELVAEYIGIIPSAIWNTPALRK